MANQSRLEDLRRRVQRDPASIAFAQLAEEYRRGGQYAESVEACRAGLALHPGYLSARVTLGRALIELNELDEAQSELELVLKSAPENLAAIRGLADILHKRGDLSGALAQYKAALALARNDPNLEETVNDLTGRLAPTRGPDPKDGLSLDQMRSVFAQHAPLSVPKATPILEASAVPLPASPVAMPITPPAEFRVAPSVEPLVAPSASGAPPAELPVAPFVELPDALSVEPPAAPSVALLVDPPVMPATVVIQLADPTRARALLQIGALEQWLSAVHAARTERSA